MVNSLNINRCVAQHILLLRRLTTILKALKAGNNKQDSLTVQICLPVETTPLFNA